MKKIGILSLYILALMIVGISCSNDDGSIQEETPEGLYDLFVYDVFNGTTKKITDTQSTEIDIRTAPTNNFITYQGESVIQMLDINGDNLKTIVDSYAYGGYDLSPDGRQITYSDGNSIYLKDINGTSIKQLTDSSSKLYRPKFSPNGTTILTTGDNGLFLVDLDGNIKQIYTEISENTGVDTTDWSFDSSKIVFDLYLGTSSAVFVYDIDSDNLQELGIGFQPGWHPSKLEVLFNHYVSPNESVLVSVAADGGQRTVINFQGFHLHHSYSPDGSKITFINEKGNVVIIENDGGGYKEINQLKENSWEPNWSHDNRYIVYYRAIWYQ